MAKAKANTKVSADKTTTSGGSSGYNGPDDITQGRVGEIWNAAQGAANAGVPGAIGGAQNYYTGQMGYGNQGNAALGGDAAAAAKYMNPYQNQVIDSMMEQFARGDKRTEMQMNDAATRAGAFGGSRHGIATGTALAENRVNQNAQIAGLLNSGFEGAMGRAAQQAGMGFNAAGAGANLGMTAGSPDLWRLEALRRGFSGMPYGQTYTSQGNQSGYNAGYAIPGMR
jgi:hypothetical protein